MPKVMGKHSTSRGSGKQSPNIFGKEEYPHMAKASKYDHGQGPQEFTRMNKAVAGTGPSQHPKQVKLAPGTQKRGN